MLRSLTLLFVSLAAFGQREDAGPARLGPWQRATPAEMGMNEKLLEQARDYALKGGGSGIVIFQGRQVYSWGDLKALYDLKSTTKSIGVTALGLALRDGKVKLEDKAAKYLPDFGAEPVSNLRTGWLREITLLHLASQTAGFDKPGGFQPLLFKPGTNWSYSDGGPNWLADVMTLVFKRDLQDVLFERVFSRLGIMREDLRWRDHQYRPKLLSGIPRREFGSGVFANVDAMARIGFFYLRAGGIGPDPTALPRAQVLPSAFVSMVRQPVPQFQSLPVVKEDVYTKASTHYGLLWWNNAGGMIQQAPRDMYWSWGLYDSLIIVIPSMDLVIARAGKSLSPENGADRPAKLRPLVEPIIQSIPVESIRIQPPYPPSPVIRSVEWAGRETIGRAAAECYNWPLTWADDDALYGAYGDGFGFEPFLPKKLGLGFARILGPPHRFEGINIQSSAQNTGIGAAGAKASGMLMVDGVLYMFARNTKNSQLAWSTDRGKTWTWADWKFTTSFGHPAFLNFGKNYTGARDNYVYVYSMDGDTAY